MTPYDTSWTGKKDVTLRNYTNIYATRNVDNPLGDSIKLGYISNIDEIKFKTDDFTYFHFPLKKIDQKEAEDRAFTASDLSNGVYPSNKTKETNLFCAIEDTTLINDGATCGSAPYKADRIYKMRYDYENTSPYGKAQPEVLNNGKWLCSWLSGNVLNKDVKPVWMDRWFDPKAITEEDAINYSVDNYSFKSDSYSVYDRPSTMTFDFGAYYRYWRVGNQTIEDVVDKIGIGGSLKIHHNDWKKDVKSTDIEDRIIYTNIDETSLDNYRVSDDFENGDYAITFNGKNQFAVVPYNDDVGHVTVDQYSISFWVRNDAWADSTTYSIVDNMYSGGWKFGVTNRSDNLFIYLFGNDENNKLQDGTSCLFNVNGDLVSTKTYWKNNELNGYKANIKDMLIDIDNYCYVLDYDDTHKVTYVRKIDYYGNQIGFVKIDDQLQYLDMSNENHNYVLYAYTVDETRAAVYQIDRYTLHANKLSNEESIDPETHAPIMPTHPPCEDDDVVNPIINVIIRVISNIGVIKIREEYFTFNKNNAVVVDNGDETIDGVWIDKSRNLKFHSFATVDDLVSVAADYDNNIWVLHSDSVDKYSVVNHVYRVVKSFPIRKNAGANMIDFLTKNVNGKNIDYILLVSSEKQCVYMYDTSGEAIDSYDSSKFYVKPNNGRYCTMYDWYRRNRYLTNCIYFDVFDSVGHNRIRKYLTECSDKEWHLLSASVGLRNDGNYVARFYFDCQLVGEKVIQPVLKKDNTVECSTAYKFDSAIVLGGICGKIHPIMEEINVVNGSFRGSIDDFRVYDRVIKAEDMYYIYMLKYACEDLTWHIKNSNKNYVENIEKFYKFKMPGSKSAQYVLHIKGYKNENGELDEELKNKLEDMIHKAFKKTTPAYTSLLKIVWE